MPEKRSHQQKFVSYQNKEFKLCSPQGEVVKKLEKVFELMSCLNWSSDL